MYGISFRARFGHERWLGQHDEDWAEAKQQAGQGFKLGAELAQQAEVTSHDT